MSTAGVEFRSEDYTAAHANQLLANLRAATEELPDHPDLKAPDGPELEPAHRGIFVVGYVNGRAMASGAYRMFPGDPSGDTAELVRLYVSPDARRTGLGRALLTELEERAADDEYTHAVLPVGVDQRSAQAMFEFLGYRRVPGEPDAWNRVIYRKSLAAD